MSRQTTALRPPHLAFAVRLIYQGVTYFSEPARLASETGEVVADITVYETTEDPAAVLINQLHLFLVPLGGRVQVTEYYWLGNAGTRAFVGADDSEAARRQKIESMPAAEKKKLLRRQEQFAGLELAEQERIRQLHDDLQRDPEGDGLRKVMGRGQLETASQLEQHPLRGEKPVVAAGKTTIIDADGP